MTTIRLWEIRGKGRCATATAYVLGQTEAAARCRLLRDDASPFFEVESVRPFGECINAQSSRTAGRG